MIKTILKEIWVPLIFFGISWVVIYQNNKLRKENDRLSDNTEILIEQNGKFKSEVEVMRLNKDELKKVIEADSSLKSHLRDSLKIKDKQIRTLIKAQISIKDTFVMPIYRDSIVYKDTIIPVQKFRHEGKFITLDGTIKNDTVFTDYDYSSEADAIIYKNKIKKWWWQRIFEKSKLRASIKADDPKCKIKIRNTIVIEE